MCTSSERIEDCDFDCVEKLPRQTSLHELDRVGQKKNKNDQRITMKKTVAKYYWLDSRRKRT